MSKASTKNKLGTVEFSDWYDTPVFDPDPDERIEELATTARGPLRLAASALLRFDARTARLRRNGHHPSPAVEAAPEVRAPAAVGAPARKPRSAATPRAGKMPKAKVDEKAWTAWADGAQDNGLDHALEQLHEDRRPGVRKRIAGALDRWAERETTLGLRIDQALFRGIKEP